MEYLLRPIESWMVSRRPVERRFPPTFVLGAPRGGTTLPALHLFEVFRFAYLPNASKDRPRTPFLRARLALRAAGEVPHAASYQNSYGRVDGPLGLSDGWSVLERWFAPYVEATEDDALRLDGLESLIARLERLFGGPFLCKNNANSMRVRALARRFPRALFVHVRRDLPETVASLLEARERHGVAPGAWWSAAPPQFLERDFDSALEQAVATVWGIQRYLEEQLEELASGRSLHLDYVEFCRRPDELVEWVRGKYRERGIELEERPAPPGGRPRSFEPSRLPPERLAELELRIAPIVAELERQASQERAG